MFASLPRTPGSSPSRPGSARSGATKTKSLSSAQRIETPGRTPGPPLSGGFRGCRAWSLAHTGPLFREAGSGRRALEAGALRLARLVPEPPPRGAFARSLASRVQLWSLERGAPRPRRGARPGTLARPGAIATRTHHLRRSAVEAQARPRVPRPRLRDGHRARVLDPLRSHRGATLRPLRRHHRHKRGTVHKL